MSKGTNHVSKAFPFCCFNYPAIKKMKIKQEPTGSSNCTSTENLDVVFFKHQKEELAKDYQTTQTSAKTEIAIENLEKIGYNKVNEGGYRVNQSGYELSLNLLINADNPTRVSAANLIAANLKAVGIKLNITALPFESYKAALENGQFQLYLGECVIDMNFNLEPLVVPGGSCAYGVTAT